MSIQDDGHPHISTERARAGATPRMTRYILAFSLLIVVIAFAIIVASGAHGTTTMTPPPAPYLSVES